MIRFEEAYQGWQEKKLTQEDAARLLGVSDRTFRRYLVDYKEQGIQLLSRLKDVVPDGVKVTLVADRGCTSSVIKNG